MSNLKVTSVKLPRDLLDAARYVIAHDPDVPSLGWLIERSLRANLKHRLLPKDLRTAVDRPVTRRNRTPVT